MTREKMLETIEAVYAARLSEDCSGLEALMVPGATFRFGGDNSLIEGLPAEDGTLMGAVKHLNEGVRMLSIENVDSVAEGTKMAALWRIEARFGECEPFTTMLYNLWHFADDGRIESCVEFIDTALAQQKMAEAEG